MRKLILSLAATPLILGSIAVSAQAADDVAVKADSGFNVFSDVKFKGELRPRYQFTNNKAPNKNVTPNVDTDAGHQLTMRTNLNFSAKLFEIDGLNAEIEMNNVTDFGTQSPKTDDSGGEATVSKLSQANISYTNSGVTGILGRKTVNLDNQRFIGSVGWKQNFQTLDIAAVAYGTDDFNILAAYVYGVNAIKDEGNIYGKRSLYGGGATSGQTTSAALNASYKFVDPVKLTGYAYLLGSASDTYGLAVTGKVAMGDSAKLNYRVEGAIQTKASLKTSGANSAYGSAAYLNLDVGANVSGFLMGLNYEVLGGAKDGDTDTTAFQTPLATKHKFNGWADQFLVTPDSGLADLNVRGGYKFDTAGKIIGVYHIFGAAADDASKSVKTGDTYGTEFDIAYSVKLPGVTGVNALLKGAMYMDKGSNIVTKGDSTLVWAQLDYKFATK